MPKTSVLVSLTKAAVAGRSADASFIKGDAQHEEQRSEPRCCPRLFFTGPFRGEVQTVRTGHQER
jgi:hypothetical protein